MKINLSLKKKVKQISKTTQSTMIILERLGKADSHRNRDIIQSILDDQNAITK